MSGLFDYRVATQLAASDPPFDALVMAAVMKADSTNRARLGVAFPELVAETTARYVAAGGLLDTDGARS
ncbi:MAG: hypothetical protein EPO40_02955 [Myxococcaceae bacterium]|nr:MAG: hypothetical protein EPO40_02955 [Myxococcaceae bacterium]